MSQQYGVEIEGLDEFIADLLSLGEVGIRKLRPATIDAANVVATTARLKAPVGVRTIKTAAKHDSKKLRDGIVVKIGSYKRGSYKISSRVELAPGASHGIPVELGHRLYMFGRKTLRHIEGRPFLRPAADESKRAVATIMTDAINEAIEELGGK